MSPTSRVRRRSLGAAITFAVVAAVSGVIGGKLTSRLTLALVIFVGLVAAGMVLTYRMERAASSADKSGTGGPPSRFGDVDLRGSQGVQMGGSELAGK